MQTCVYAYIHAYYTWCIDLYMSIHGTLVCKHMAAQPVLVGIYTSYMLACSEAAKACKQQVPASELPLNSAFVGILQTTQKPLASAYT